MRGALRWGACRPPSPTREPQLRNYPIATEIHAPPDEIVAESLLGGGPNVARRRLAEYLRVTGNRTFILRVKVFLFAGSAARRPVMNPVAQYAAAEIVPIAVRVDQMQMPDLVYIFAGRHCMIRRDSQKHEPLVLVDHSHRIAQRPAVLSRQTAGERELRRRIVERKAVNPLPKFRPLG